MIGPSGEQMSEFGMDANNKLAWQHSNVYAADKLLATYDADGLHFYLDDPLGSRRVQTDYAGVVEQSCASLPFGDNLACSGSTQYPTEHHFTGKERDVESGLDYFGARYYASSLARFMSPDWSDTPDTIPFGSLRDPQTLNLYAYVKNNPLREVDEDGHGSSNSNCNTRTTSGKDGTFFVSVSCFDTFRSANIDLNSLGHHALQLVAKHPIAVNAIFTGGEILTALSGLVDGGASELALPAEEAVDVALESAAEDVADSEGIAAADGTQIKGFTEHGVDRAIGDAAKGTPGARAGTKPQAILDALKNPKKITSGIDSQGRPYKVFTGSDARVVVNPQSGRIVSVNPLSGAGAH